MPQHGELRVWWIPQIPMKAFFVPVANVVEAKVLLDALAEYDKFQFENRIKPDYSNSGGLHVFDVNDDHDGPEGSWYDWYDQEGEDLDHYTLEEIRANPPKWENDDA
jgi:hypothetical protein